MNLQARLVQTHQAYVARQQQAIGQAHYLQPLQAGDPQAWEHFVTEWSPRLYRYLHANLRHAEQATQALSATLLAVVHAIRRFDGRMTLAAFVYALAYRQVVASARRQGQAHRPLWLRPAGPRPASEEVDETLRTLPEAVQQILLLHYTAGLSVAEIAQVLGRSPQATAALLNQGRRRFFRNGRGAG